MQAVDLDGRRFQVKDLESSIEIVRNELLDLRSEADPESIYDCATFKEEDVQYLRQIMEIYNKAIEACEEYLLRKITLKCLYVECIRLNLKHILWPIRKFLKKELKRQFYSEESSEDGSIDQDSDDDENV